MSTKKRYKEIYFIILLTYCLTSFLLSQVDFTLAITNIPSNQYVSTHVQWILYCWTNLGISYGADNTEATKASTAP